jgi:hypothetical protein
MSGVEQLLAGFHGAGSGNHHDLWSADPDTVYVHNRPLRPHLPAYQLKRLRDRDYCIDARSDLECLNFVAPATPHRGDDGPFHATRDVRLIAGLTNALDHMGDFLLCGFLRHVDDHVVHFSSSIYGEKNKAATKSRLPYRTCLKLDQY